jgi:hypothetical protein
MKKMRHKPSKLEERSLPPPDLHRCPYPVNTSLWGCLHPFYTTGSDARMGFDGTLAGPTKGGVTRP